jgi:hypothetical protein
MITYRVFFVLSTVQDILRQEQQTENHREILKYFKDYSK